MKKILSTSESIDPCQEGRRLTDVCATGEATFSERKHELVVRLDSFWRKSEWGRKEQRKHLPWLPGKQTIREHLSWEEALPAARSIFHNWTKRIRRCLADHEEEITA